MSNDLSLEFIKRRFKTEEEIDYICNVVFAKYLSLKDKINYVASIDMIYLEQIKTIFNLTYKQANMIIGSLLDSKAIIEYSQDKYIVNNHKELKSILKNKLCDSSNK